MWAPPGAAAQRGDGVYAQAESPGPYVYDYKSPSPNPGAPMMTMMPVLISPTGGAVSPAAAPGKHISGQKEKTASDDVVCHDRAVRRRMLWYRSLDLVCKLVLIGTMILFTYLGFTVHSASDFYEYNAVSGALNNRNTPTLTQVVSGNLFYLQTVSGYGFDPGYIFLPATCVSTSTPQPQDLLDHMYDSKGKSFKSPDYHLWNEAAKIGICVLIVESINLLLLVVKIRRLCSAACIIATGSSAMTMVGFVLTNVISFLTGASFLMIVTTIPSGSGLFTKSSSSSSLSCSYQSDSTHTPTTLFSLQGTMAGLLITAVVVSFVLSLVAIFLRVLARRKVVYYKAREGYPLSKMDVVFAKVTCLQRQRQQQKQQQQGIQTVA